MEFDIFSLADDSISSIRSLVVLHASNPSLYLVLQPLLVDRSCIWLTMHQLHIVYVEIKNHKQAQQLVLNENTGAKKFRVSVTPVPIQEDHEPQMPPSDDDEEEEHHQAPVHIEYIEYGRTPSMEESETLGGFNSFNPTPETPNDEEDDDDDEAIEQKKKETPVPTPISTATPMSTTSNYSNRSGHMRKATPAEMPSVKAIKKFSINLNETPLCEEMEEFTPRADQD
eukprot:716078_1